MQLDYWMDFWMHTKLMYSKDSPLIDGQRCHPRLSLILFHTALIQRCTESRIESYSFLMKATEREEVLSKKAIVDFARECNEEQPRDLGHLLSNIISSLKSSARAKSSLYATRQSLSQTGEMLRHARGAFAPVREKDSVPPLVGQIK